MRTLSRLVPLSVVAALLVPAAPAVAASTSQTGTVTRVADGDTYEVSIPGSGTLTVRMAGIQATELGECHAAEATTRLEQLIEGRKVTVSADSYSSTNRGRYLRFTDIGSHDIGLTMLAEGKVFAFPSQKEGDRNRRYLLASQLASRAGIGVWDDDACGSGPYQDVPLDMVVKWDADGDDSKNLNGEWVRITNKGSRTISLSGWTLRDSALNIFTFPSGTSIPAGGQLYVHVGSGTNTSTRLYWRQSGPVFENEIGDGAILIDPDGDIRAHFFFPCLAFCSDPAAGSLSISANPDAPGNDNDNPNGETISLRNTGSKTLDLGGYLVESWPYSMELRGDSRVHPGETLTIHIGSGTNSRLTRHWGFSSGILGNGGDTALLKTFAGTVVVCTDWGTESCPATGGGTFLPVSTSAGESFDHWTAPSWSDAFAHPFEDLDRSWMADPVGFLAANDITTGVSARSFAPNRNVTRGEMAAFLWRLAGRPNVTTAHGFVDVTKSWQQAPVRWLKASGITTGVDATHFAPDRQVTRGEMAAFLWRLVDEPYVSKSHGFRDVDKSWQEVPVRWLKARGITNGISSTEFGAADPVTRGQMAAFLHRLAQRL